MTRQPNVTIWRYDRAPDETARGGGFGRERGRSGTSDLGLVRPPRVERRSPLLERRDPDHEPAAPAKAAETRG